MTLQDVITILLTAERTGSEKDEPEGSRMVHFSDTLIRQMADALMENNNVIHNGFFGAEPKPFLKSFEVEINGMREKAEYR